MISSLFLYFWMSSATMAAPIARHFVDMTYTFDETTVHFPTIKKYEMTVVLNGTLLNGIWVQAEEYSSGTHVGTHMDAPSHFTKGGINIDQIPVSHFIAPAAVIDITQKAEQNPDAEATIEDLTEWERITGQTLNKTIILFRSGWGSRWSNRTAYIGTPDNDISKLHFPGVDPAAAQWLIDNRNIYGIGVDTLSFDRGSSTDFMSHQLLLGHGIFGLENVANMEQLPIYGATLYVMPMKLKDASGAPTRVVATYPEIYFRPQTEN